MAINTWNLAEVLRASTRGNPVRPRRPLRVLLFDLLPTVPYYTGHLSAALSDIKDLDVTVGCATYTHDRTFFKRIGVHNGPGLFDFAHRVQLTALRRPLKVCECILNMLALSLRFLKSTPDVIHVQFTPLAERKLPFELWFLRRARAHGVKVVYTVHNVLPHDSSGDQVEVYRTLYGLIDQFICHDEHARMRLAKEFAIDPARIAVIPHGPLFPRTVNEHLTDTSTDPKRRSLACIVLCQGIIRPYKGVRFLLQAWKAACDRGLNATLRIVGTGERRILKQIVEDVRFLGIASSVRLDFRFVSVEQLADYYLEADILVYPYTQATTSGALMTGIGYKKAVIASDLPAFGQVLRNEENALLVPVAEVGAWATALCRMASDVALRARLQQGLAENLATPDWREIAQDTYDVYQQILPDAISR
ncbi:MAG TPA: glycosyltransferase family 4 protein [Candidatus Sulfotelmatobacter sp.]|nr:glycosyltransferase family 4 protein [Candidatus Sulfotelmatobacter sp.]